MLNDSEFSASLSPGSNPGYTVAPYRTVFPHLPRADQQAFRICKIPRDRPRSWVKIDTKDNPLYVGSFYRTPSNKSELQLLQLDKYLNHIQTLTRKNPNSTVVVSSEFNAGDIDWEYVAIPIGTSDRNICSKLLEILNIVNLEQQQMSLSREYKILDLLSTNKPGLTKSIHTLAGFFDHEIVCADCNIRACISKKKRTTKRVHM